jgi:integrase
MSITVLPNGRLRAQVYDPVSGKNVSVAKVLGLPRDQSTFPDTRQGRRDAVKAREAARDKINAMVTRTPTVAEFRERWLTDPLFERPKLSTMIHNRERTKAFTERYGRLMLSEVGDEVVGEWIAGGRNVWTVQALRSMFNDAASAKAGRLIPFNPFAGLGVERSRGNRDIQPPSQEQMENMIRVARSVDENGRRLVPPSFAAWLEFACCTAMRPGEIDALRWTDVDFDGEDIHVARQFSVKSWTFTPPKYGPYTCALVGRAKTLLESMPREAGSDTFVFTTVTGKHYTASSRQDYWKTVRDAAGLGGMTLYLATRHYFGWYAMNVLELDARDIAEQLGHKDGGRLVEQLYGHPDKAKRRAKVRDAYNAHGRVTPLRVVRGGRSD